MEVCLMRALLIFAVTLCLLACGAVAPTDQPPETWASGDIMLGYELSSTGADQFLLAEVAAIVAERLEQLGIEGATVRSSGSASLHIGLPAPDAEALAAVKQFMASPASVAFLLAQDEDTDFWRAHSARLAALLAARPELGLDVERLDLASLSVESGGVGYRWLPRSDAMIKERRVLAGAQSEFASTPLEVEDFVLVAFERDAFGATDLASIRQTTDNSGRLALMIELEPASAARFGDWTEAHIGRRVAFVVGERLVSEPAMIQDRIEGRLVISSGLVVGFRAGEVAEMMSSMRGGALTVLARLVSEEFVATIR